MSAPNPDDLDMDEVYTHTMGDLDNNGYLNGRTIEAAIGAAIDEAMRLCSAADVRAMVERRLAGAPYPAPPDDENVEEEDAS